MKITKPFMTGFPGGGGSIPSGKGHLFGDALFNADFFQLQNTEGEEIIKYTKEGGLEIAGGGSGNLIVWDDEKEPAQQAAEAVIAMVRKGVAPVIFLTGPQQYFHLFGGSVDAEMLGFVAFIIDETSVSQAGYEMMVFMKDAGEWKVQWSGATWNATIVSD